MPKTRPEMGSTLTSASEASFRFKCEQILSFEEKKRRRCCSIGLVLFSHFLPKCDRERERERERDSQTEKDKRKTQQIDLKFVRGICWISGPVGLELSNNN